jgi:hypothetical protein
MGKRKGKGQRPTGATADEVDTMMTRPAPVMVSPGTSAWEEFTVRRILPDGRIVDSEPMREPAATWSLRLQSLAYPAGTEVQVLHRQVTAHATDWAPVDAGDLSVWGRLGPFGDAIKRMEDIALGVQHCSWCPDPNQPLPAAHPGGQVEHVPVSLEPAQLLPGVVRPTSANVYLDEPVWVADDLDSDQVRLLGAHGWVVEARGGQYLVRRAGTVPASEQPTQDLTERAAQIRVSAAGHAGHAEAEHPDTCAVCREQVGETMAEYVADGYNAAQQAAEAHAEHGRAEHPDSCQLCQAEAEVDGATAADVEQPERVMNPATPAFLRVMGYGAAADAAAAELAADDRPTAEIPKVVDAGPHAVPAGEGAKRRSGST